MLPSATIGRVVYTKNALPAVEPVNFTFDDGCIVIAVTAGSDLSRAVPNTVVAFQADDLDDVSHGGWTVTVIGHAGELTGPGRSTRQPGTGSASGAAAGGGQFIKITTGIVTGQELLFAGEPRPACAPHRETSSVPLPSAAAGPSWRIPGEGPGDFQPCEVRCYVSATQPGREP